MTTVVLVIGGALVVVYVLDVLIFWRNSCRMCSGRGKFNSPLTRGSNVPCPRCSGSGKRTRFAWLRGAR